MDNNHPLFESIPGIEIEDTDSHQDEILEEIGLKKNIVQDKEQ